MVKVSKYIKQQDMFGHQVVLNFNKKGDTYQTTIGGAISLLVKLVIFGFVVYKIILLVGLKDNSYE